MENESAEGYITIAEAARIGGFRDPSGLYTAVRRNKLRVKRFGNRMQLTTQAWLDEYLASVKPRSNPRGQPKAATDEVH